MQPRSPTVRRSNNTVANEMQVLRAFFTELEDTEEISRSPFRKISRDRRVILTRKKYDDPIFLRKEEFEALRNFKLARATHVDMMAKVQINLYAAGLHRQGSGAVTHYTMLELADRFKLMNLAFDQEDYRVDKNLEVIPK